MFEAFVHSWWKLALLMHACCSAQLKETLKINNVKQVENGRLLFSTSLYARSERVIC